MTVSGAPDQVRDVEASRAGAMARKGVHPAEVSA